MSIPLTQKYAPKNTADLPQKTASAQLKLFIQEYKKQKKKAALIYGSAGTGKTSTVYAIAKELNLELIEVNASDVRNGESINEILGNALKQQSLFYSGKIILMDEVDGVAGNQDRGGIQALTKLIEESKFPIVLTANDPWDKKFSTLRMKSVMIQFQTLNYKTIKNILKEICEKENVKNTDDELNTIALRCGGDLRGAINDLQSTILNGAVSKGSVETIESRDKVESILNALLKVFKGKEIDTVISAFDNLNEDYEKVMLWLDENLPKEYKDKEDLFKAYDKLSLADVFLSRIRKQQYWRLLVYVNAFLSAGIAVSKKEKNKGFISYTPTTRILKIWKANMKYAKKKSIAEKLAKKTHCSRRKAMQEIEFLKLACKSKKFQENFTQTLELDEEEQGWLKKE